MSQYTYLGIDIHSLGNIPKSALKHRIMVKNKLLIKILKYFANNNIFRTLWKYGDLFSVLLIISFMALNIIYCVYALIYGAIKSFELQDQYGFQSMSITLLTLFTYVLISAISNTVSAFLKLRNYKKMEQSEFRRRITAIHRKGFVFLIWSFIATCALVGVPMWLSSSNPVMQTNNAKIAGMLALFIVLLIEKFAENSLTAKLD